MALNEPLSHYLLDHKLHLLFLSSKLTTLASSIFFHFFLNTSFSTRPSLITLLKIATAYFPLHSLSPLFVADSNKCSKENYLNDLIEYRQEVILEPGQGKAF